MTYMDPPPNMITLNRKYIVFVTEYLDVEVSDSEFRDFMFSQNNNKSPVIDLLTSEMF